ncbi:MAG: peptidoglycan -binding protein [Sulfitobacter geojensis]
MALSRRTGARFQSSIWPGFVDAMTGLLLVLMFVLTIFMVVQFVLTERITGQETELDTLAGEVAALAQALGLEERDNAQLEARLGALNASLQTAQDQATEQAAVIASLTAQRDSKAEELDAAAGQITAFEAQVAGLLAEQERDQVALSDLQAREAQLISDQEALNLALATARTEIDAQAEAARLSAARREALDALVADLQARNAQSEAQVVALQGQVDAGAEALSAEEAARVAEAAAAEALRARLADADTELTAMTLALEAQRQEAEDTLTLLAAARAAESDLDQKLAETLIRLQSAEQGAQAAASVQTDLAAANAEIARLEGEVTQLGNTVADLRGTVAAEQAATEQAAQSGAALQGELTAAEQELNRLRADVAAQEAQAAELNTDREALRARLAAAVAARLAAETAAQDQETQADTRAALLAAARSALSEEKTISAEAQRQTELLNQQVAALRMQLGNLQSLLDDAKARDISKEVELQSLGSELNTALARVAAEERRRAESEAAERARLEAEALALKEETKDLEQYRSEFFGRLRDVLGAQEGVRIEGDRFVFSSEVLFPPGGAVLSDEGRGEIAKVASILRSVAGDIPAEIDWVIRVDGHTDNEPLSGFGEFADNWELSQARALSVVKYMINFLGIPPDRLAANGFGQYQPVAAGDSEAARAQNRRIELKFTEK